MKCLFLEAVGVWLRPVRTSGLSQTDVGISPQSCELLQSSGDKRKTDCRFRHQDSKKQTPPIFAPLIHISDRFPIILESFIISVQLQGKKISYDASISRAIAQNTKSMIQRKTVPCFMIIGLFSFNLQLQISQAGTIRPGSPGWTAPTLPDRPEPESGCWSRSPSG